MKKIILAITAFLLVALFPNQASASHSYTYSNFPHNYFLDNSVFRDHDSMTQSQIQSFLNSMGGELAGKSFSGKTAAKIIYDAARDYGVNPKVIITTLQKEQTLITHPNPESWRYNSAMGYGCPTSGECSSQYAGFANQVDNGVWQLRLNYERANGNNGWWNSNIGYACKSPTNFYSKGLFPGNRVDFKRSSGQIYQTTTLANAATAALYCYTPHAYSQYYTGSYNFVVSFQHWFGTTYAGPLDFEPLDTPRWMQARVDARKKQLKLGVNEDKVVGQGTQIFFDTKIEIDGVMYLRTAYDTENNNEKGIAYSELEDIIPQYTSLDRPREMQVIVDTHNKNPVTNTNITSIPKDTKMSFDTKVQIGGEWYLRSEEDTESNLVRGVPLSALDEVLVFEVKWSININLPTHIQLSYGVFIVGID